MGKVTRVNKYSFICDKEREFEVPFYLGGVTVSVLNDWIEYYNSLLEDEVDV
jgi:hypothetical protein